MILRHIALRHGRKAMTAKLGIQCIRSISTDVERIESSIEHHMKETESIQSSINLLSHAKHTVEPGAAGTRDAVAVNHRKFVNINNTTGALGSILEPSYEPHKLLTQPPSPKDVTLELLMASQAHIGHSTSLWNPANQRYIYGVRQGVHIISLEVIAAHLRRAARVVEGVTYHGGLVLFVGTRPGQHRSVVKAAQLSRGCHLFERWIPGSITNSDQLLANCRMKVMDELDREMEGEVFDEKLSDHRSLKPDLVVCMNPLENYVLLHECGLHNIPTIGVVDTDADPTWVTYPIPANDDSLRCIQLIAGVLGRAGEAGQKKRLEAARTGHVTWRTENEFRGWAKQQKLREKAAATTSE